MTKNKQNYPCNFSFLKLYGLVVFQNKLTFVKSELASEVLNCSF